MGIVITKLDEIVNKYREYKKVDNYCKGSNTFFNFSDKGFLLDSIIIGSFVLIQIYLHHSNWRESALLSKPLLCIYLGRTVWQQSIVAKLFEIPRRYHYENCVDLQDESLNSHLFYSKEKIAYIPEWYGDDVVLLEQWQSKPSFKELLNACRKKI
jgi:hypothetical protein